MNRIYTAIGLMSGTSCDGVDIALLRTDGHDFVESLQGMKMPYNPELQKKIKALMYGDLNELFDVENKITKVHSHLVNRFLESLKIDPATIDVIGFHGQTIKHSPENGMTVQIGNIPQLAQNTGIPVAGDFRRFDVASGGQGAPLVPIYIKALAAKLGYPTLYLNIGGVTNVCYVSHDDLIALDAGPGNAPVNDWVEKKYGLHLDVDGKIAAKGKVSEKHISSWLTDSYFSRQAPKSLDRNHFKFEGVDKLNGEDGAATLTEFSALCIAHALRLLPSGVNRIIVSGGGRKNLHLMNRITHNTGIIAVNCDELGLDGDLLEAQAFAYLGVRSMLGLPISFPRTTGVAMPMCGGIMCNAPRGGQLHQLKMAG
jgi:anhydro-N-acetylmuramic acid kinase